MEVKINGVYKHFNGDYYLLVDIGYNSDTLEKCVIYRALYGEGNLWIRPYDDFFGLVNKDKYPNATQKYKFELQKIESVRI